MRFTALGSGSRGNATLIEAGDTRILLDCGFPLKVIEARLAGLGVAPASLAAIVVTHEHADHIGGVARLAARHRLPVWATPGTWRGAQPALARANGAARDLDLRLFCGHGRGFRIGALHLAPFPVPHDAREPCQFVIEADGQRLGILTDAGHITARIQERLAGCDALILETNHDPALLAAGPYPPSVRARVAGPFGHLSNSQAADLLDRLDHARLKHLLLAHLSAQNNRSDLARAAILAVDADLAPRLTLADQDQPGGWLDLRGALEPHGQRPDNGPASRDAAPLPSLAPSLPTNLARSRPVPC